MNDPTFWLNAVFGNVTVVQAVLWLCGIIVIIIFLRKSWPAFRRFVRTVDALGELPDSLAKLDTIEEKLAVLDELRPNHGGSIRDRVGKISTDLVEHIEMCKMVEANTNPIVVPAPRSRAKKKVVDE